jgi:hypothetical protein
MSKKCDSQKQIRLEQENFEELVLVQQSYPVAVSLAKLANKAISFGLPLVAAKQKPKTKGK